MEGKLVTLLTAVTLMFQGVAAAEQWIDLKPDLLWMSDDSDIVLFDEPLVYDSFVGKSEVWGKNWGISAELFQNDDDVFGMPQDSEFFNLDVKRRFGSIDKSLIELGLGWQELNIESQLAASGPKLSLQGTLNLKGSIQLYGLTSWFPELDDSYNDGDVTAYELEAGVMYQPLPSISLKAGYRRFVLDLNDQVVEDLGSSSGFLFGTDWSW